MPSTLTSFRFTTSLTHSIWQMQRTGLSPSLTTRKLCSFDRKQPPSKISMLFRPRCRVLRVWSLDTDSPEKREILLFWRNRYLRCASPTKVLVLISDRLLRLSCRDSRRGILLRDESSICMIWLSSRPSFFKPVKPSNIARVTWVNLYVWIIIFLIYNNIHITEKRINCISLYMIVLKCGEGCRHPPRSRSRWAGIASHGSRVQDGGGGGAVHFLPSFWLTVTTTSSKSWALTGVCVEGPGSISRSGLTLKCIVVYSGVTFRING